MPLPNYIQSFVEPNTSIKKIRFISFTKSYISFQTKRLRSSNRIRETVLPLNFFKRIYTHLETSRSIASPCNNTILQLIIHEVNQRDRDWPHSSSRIAPLSSVLLTNPLSMRIPSREATATQFRRSSTSYESPYDRFPTYYNSLRSYGRRCDDPWCSPWDFQSPKNKSPGIVMLIRRVRLNARSTESWKKMSSLSRPRFSCIKSPVCVCVYTQAAPSARTPRSNVCGHAVAATCLTLRTREPHCDFNRRSALQVSLTGVRVTAELFKLRNPPPFRREDESAPVRMQSGDTWPS